MADGGGVLREMIALFTFGVDTKELKKGERDLGDFFGKVKGIAQAFAGAFALHEIFAFAEAQAHLLDKLDDTAAALGISTERVQEYRYASEALGDDADKLLNSMGRLQVAQQAAAAGSKAQAEAFKDIAVGVKGANGEMKSADELFADVAEGIKNTEDPSKAAAVAVKLFGKSGRELLPFLKEGRAGIEELREEFKQLGGGYTEKAIKAGGKFEHQMARWGLVTKSLKSQILVGLFPVLTKLVDWATKLARAFGEWTKNSEIVRAAMVVLGAAATYFAVQMAIASAPILLIVAAIALLIAVVDDIIVTFEGGSSVIRRALDAMFGEGYTTDLVKSLGEAWKVVAGAIKSSWEWLTKYRTEIAGLVEILPPVALYRMFKGEGVQDNANNQLRDTVLADMRRRGALGTSPPDMFDVQAEALNRNSPLVLNNNVNAQVNVVASPGREKEAGQAVASELEDATQEGWGVLQQVPATGR